MTTMVDSEIASMGRKSLVDLITQQKTQIEKLHNNLLRTQIIAATRLDTIRLLGFIANRDPSPDPIQTIPENPAVKRIVAIELRNLSTHLRKRADEFDSQASRIEESIDKNDNGGDNDSEEKESV